MSRPSLVVHGHFYQPPRLDPFSGTMPRDPTATPAHDWNERIADDCYRPSAEIGNLGAISWDLGPTLAGYAYDVAGSYDLPILASAVLSLAGGAVIMCLPARRD